MSASSEHKTALEWFRDIALPIATALMTVTLPLIVGLYRDVGRLEEKLAGLDQRWSDKIENASRQAELANQKAEAILVSVNRLNDRLTEREADPLSLLARLGIEAKSGIISAIIDGQVYLFPKTVAARDLLVKEGFVPSEIGPSITGFPVKKQGG